MIEYKQCLPLLPVKVRNDVIRGEERIRTTGKLPKPTVNWFAKSAEKNYPDKWIDKPESRPRCISAFTPQWKSMISAFAVNITLAYKSIDYYRSRLALGWTAQKFKYCFDKAWKTFEDPTVIWFDHSSFDASQN